MALLKRIPYIPSVIAKERHKGSFCDIYPMSVRRVLHLIFKHKRSLYTGVALGYFLVSIGDDFSDNTVLTNLVIRKKIGNKKYKL